MKYIRYFETVADYQNKRELKYWEPWVSLTTVNDDVKYNKTILEAHLTFQILSPGNVVWSTDDSSSTKTIKYSKNGGDWVTITSSTSGVSIPVVEGDYVMFEGDNTSYGHSSFSGTTCQFNVGGNIMSLVNSVDFWTEYTLTDANAFQNLFKNCSGLNFAHDLLLPATTLSSYCYASMFEDCYNLRSFPELNATNLASHCYEKMFTGCMKLTYTPELPATTVYEGSYKEMFSGCTGLIQAPELPATTLGEYCYSYMFLGCSGLTNTPSLLATVMANYCYENMFQGCTGITNPSSLPSTTLAEGCYKRMFQGCTGLTVAPELPAMTLVQACYSGMFFNCTNLTTSPELNADVLVTECYKQMFFRCNSLNHVKCLATDTSATDCTYQWLSNVASSGEFITSAFIDDTWTYDSENGIPYKWTSKFNNVTTNTPLTLYVLSDGNIAFSSSNYFFSRTINYSLNGGTLQEATMSNRSGTTISVTKGDTVQLYGDNTAYANSNYYAHVSNSTSKFNLGGNIMSLINSTNYASTTSSTTSYTFRNFFTASKVVHADSLYLYAESTGNNAGALCYQMFYSCTDLKTAPFEIIATSLCSQACEGMFYNCTSLIKGPSILATTLSGSRCCYSMFANCTNLNQVKCLATTLSGSNATTNWMNGVQTTAGLFIKNADMNDWTTDVSGIPSNWTVESA